MSIIPRRAMRRAIHLSARAPFYVAALLLCWLTLLSAYAGGNTTVTTTGTRVQLSTSPTKAVILTIVARSTNTGTIWVGGSDVSAANKIGIPLGPPVTAGQPGAAVGYDPQGNAAGYTLSEFWLDATVSGDGVTYAWK